MQLGRITMGGCLSRCGDKQPAPMVEVSLEMKTRAAASPYDPNHSLKRFLHLNQEPKNSVTSTPRTSVVDSVAIPHSSELFSLPASDLELRSNFALPSARAQNRAPRNGASISLHFAGNSPRRGCSKKRIRPAATRGEHVDVAAHQRLVDAIARLEMLNDAGKSSSFGLRGSSICGSDVAMAPKSSSSELNPAAMRSRHVRRYQLPLPKSSKDTAFTHPPKESLGTLDTTPAVSEFLRTVETFVSLIEAPRELRHREASSAGTSRRRFEETDGDELFTYEFGASEVRNRPKAVSLQRLVQSATQASNGRKSPVAEVAVPVEESAKGMSRECKSSSSIWQPIELFVKQSGTAEARVSAHPRMKVSVEQSLREEGGAAAAKLASDRNVVATRKAKSPRLPLRTGALKRLRRGRLSRSLDSMESSVIHVDLEIFRNQVATPIVASRLSNVPSPRKHPTEDAKGLELLPVSSTWSCQLELSGHEQKPEFDESFCSRSLETSTTAEPPASEILPPQEVVSLVAEAIPSTVRAEYGPRDSAGDVDKARETKKMRCEESLPSERTECTGSETTPPIVSKQKDSSPGDSTDAVLQHPKNSGESQRFGLLEAFHSLLKLLFFSNTEQAGAECRIAASVPLDPDDPNEKIRYGFSIR